MVTRYASWAYIAAVFLLTGVSTATPKYSGGTGEPNDPYQIATAADLITLGETPADYDKHFILTADIDLAPGLPGRKVFDWAVIAPGWPSFTGVFDGRGHTISHLTIRGKDHLGLFGQLGSTARVSSLGLEAVEVSGTGDSVGGLVGYNGGSIATSYSNGSVSGNWSVGGLVGENRGSIATSYSTASVSGGSSVGGLVGENDGSITTSYSTASVSGGSSVGGLVGENYRRGTIVSSYSSGSVRGSWSVGGLVGSGDPDGITHSVWDIETSGLSVSAGGVGLTTAEMMDPFLLGLNGFGDDPTWTLDTARHYPQLTWEGVPGQVIGEPDMDWLPGQGTPESPYRIDNAEQLIMLSKACTLWDKRFILVADIGLDASLANGQVFAQAVVPIFTGVFDGGAHSISGLRIMGAGYLGLFGRLKSGAVVKDLGLVDVNIIGSGDYVGGLVGYNDDGSIISSYSSGSISGDSHVGGLVGYNEGGSIATSYCSGSVSGEDDVGGLVGYNEGGSITMSYSRGSVTGTESVGGLVGVNGGSIATSYSSGEVRGTGEDSYYVGGLVGENWGSIATSYSSGSVSGSSSVGGLVGENDIGGRITTSYSSGSVTGGSSVGGLLGENIGGRITTSYSSGLVSGSGGNVGGLVGRNATLCGLGCWSGPIIQCIWDIETSDQSISAGGIGLRTVEMMDPNMLALNGFANDPNWVLDAGHDYPRLAWEGTAGRIIPDSAWFDGHGTAEPPYRITTADQLILLVRASALWYKHLVLCADIDLDPVLPGRRVFSEAPIPFFAGVFDGAGHRISHLTIHGKDNLGLFGHLEGADVKNVGVVHVNIVGSGGYVGGLVGWNEGGRIIESYSSGSVSGKYDVGGLVGGNAGSVVMSYSTASVRGTDYSVGGLVGFNYGRPVGRGSITTCYSTGPVGGNSSVGGLVGYNYGSIATSFWDTQTSGQATSAGGTGKTTAEMQTASTFLDGGWDFLDETANGTEDIWWIEEGNDYPRFTWANWAFSPGPPDRDPGVGREVVLCWKAGWPGLEHDIYFGEDAGLVAKATTETLDVYRGRQTSEVTTCDVGTLEWGTTYYWRIDEIDESDPRSPWKGDVWSFTVADFAILSVLDDFESYTDDPSAGTAIFLSWILGPMNGTRSWVGHYQPLFAEQKIVHGGRQSMPMYYSNTEDPWYSETDHTWATGQNWTIGGADTLTLFLRGKVDNSPEPLYVGIKDSSGRIAVVVHPDAEAVLATAWRKWHIPLADLQATGVDVAAVKKMIIGVGDRNNPQPGGSGRIYIDDILLTKRMP
jgi:hypothetical protein